MKVNIIGFEVSSNNAELSLNGFYKSLANTKQGFRIRYTDIDRYIYVSNSPCGNYWYGMLITAKNQKKFCRLRRENGALVIKRDFLGEDKLLDFNYFVVNKSNGVGAYTYYRGSCAIKELGAIKKRFFKEQVKFLKKRARKSKIAKILEISAKTLRGRVDRKYKGQLDFTEILRKEDLDTVLAELKKIKRVEATFYAACPSPVKPGIPLSDKSKRIKHSFTIDQVWGIEAIAHDVVELSDVEALENGRVIGVDENEKEVVIKFLNDLKGFGGFDYDDLTEDIHNLRADQFSSHCFFDQLLDKMRESDEIFFAEVEND